MAEGCRKLQDEEVRNLCSSLDIIREMKLRRMRWAAHMRVYPKSSGLAVWSKNCKWYSFLPLSAVVSLFCESV
jgi:hypothetical protein